MSTTIKRVALVAVAALGLGVTAAVPSNAAPTFAYGVIADSANGQAVIGGQATVVLTPDTNTVTNVVVSGVGTVISTTESASDVKVLGTVTTGSWSDSSTIGSATTGGTQTIRVQSSVVGVTTITATPLSATGVPGTAVTKTITWVAATTTGTYDHSTAFIAAENSSRRVYSDSTTAQLTFGSAISLTPKAQINVTQFNAADTVTVTTLTSTSVKAVTATISGAGAIGSLSNGSNAGPSITVAASSASTEQTLYVFSDGRNGVATINVSVNGVLVSTKTVNFYGTVVAYAQDADATLSKNYIGVGTGVATSESATVSIKGLDANKVVQAAGTIYATSDTTTIATVTVSGQTLYIYGVKAGKTNINVCDTSACTSATVKYSFPIEVTGKTAGKITMSLDKATYAPGEKMTLTVSAVDEAGRPVADGTRSLFYAAPTSNVTLVGTLPSTSVDLVDGVATYTLYAPATTGDFTITASEGTDSSVTAKAAAAAAGLTYTKKVITATAAVSNPSVDAATDAANEAAQAASDATDAALAAADAADAATTKAQEAVDAVATLSAQVSKLITALKAQITTLTNLVIKIQKKVKA